MRERAEAEGGGPSWTKTQNPKFTLKVMVENSELKHREKIWPRSLATGYVPLKEIMEPWPSLLSVALWLVI